MKKFTLTAAVLLMIISTAFASGDGKAEKRATIYSLQKDTYRVIYGAKDEAIVKIKITDEQGNVLREDRVKSKGGFMKPYNFKKLSDGTYTIKLTDEYGEITQQVKVGVEASAVVAAN